MIKNYLIKISLQNILEKFNPGARQLISAGKAYLKALHGKRIIIFEIYYLLNSYTNNILLLLLSLHFYYY